MATILTFSPPHHGSFGDPRRAPPPADTPAEVIVFPRAGIHALRLTDASDIGSDPVIETPGEKDTD